MEERAKLVLPYLLPKLSGFMLKTSFPQSLSLQVVSRERESRCRPRKSGELTTELDSRSPSGVEDKFHGKPWIPVFTGMTNYGFTYQVIFFFIFNHLFLMS